MKIEIARRLDQVGYNGDAARSKNQKMASKYFYRRFGRDIFVPQPTQKNRAQSVGGGTGFFLTRAGDRLQRETNLLVGLKIRRNAGRRGRGERIAQRIKVQRKE